jgi:predicted glycoside hydrolase/deacetylase ChbG (UPF0249 family)
MQKPDSAFQHLVITGDDFGRSIAVNEAVELYHRAGALEQASLMVAEEQTIGAVEITRRNLALRVGLHLTLCDGMATEPSLLTDDEGRLPGSPATAGVLFALNYGLRESLRAEIRRQFERFLSFGLPPTYWDGHCHLHLHPVILALTIPIAREYGFTKTRLVREPGSRTLVHWIFHRLSRGSAEALQRFGIGYDEQVFGLHRSGRMDVEAFRHALAQVNGASTEIYWHPGAEANPPAPEELADLLAGVNRRV